MDAPLIALSAESAYLVPAEARRLAAILMAAFDKPDEIGATRERKAPPSTKPGALRCSLRGSVGAPSTMGGSVR